MSRIITKEDTKILVRALSKEVPRSSVDEIDKHDLYYGGGKKFRWYPRDWNRIPYGMVNLEIPMSTAYRVGNKGYERRALGTLDNYLYSTINSSEIAQMKKIINKYESDVLVRVNKRLKVLTMFALEDFDGDYLVVVYDWETSNRSPENVKYTDIRGDELGNLFNRYVRDKGFDIKGVEDRSQIDYTELRLSIENLKYWDEYIKAVISFDKELNSN